MKCPACGSDEAYIGFNSIDCPTKTCKHFQGGSIALNPHQPQQAAPSPHSNPHLGSAPVWPHGNYPQGWGGAGPAVQTNLSVRISGYVPKQSNVQISFIASGDPGTPDKEVEIYFDIGNGDQLCTLSHPNVTYIPGVDADGVTVYTTNWMCLQDGVKPTDSYQLKACIQ